MSPTGYKFKVGDIVSVPHRRCGGMISEVMINKTYKIDTTDNFTKNCIAMGLGGTTTFIISPEEFISPLVPEGKFVFPEWYLQKLKKEEEKATQTKPATKKSKSQGESNP